MWRGGGGGGKYHDNNIFCLHLLSGKQMKKLKPDLVHLIDTQFGQCDQIGFSQFGQIRIIPSIYNLFQ
jgi:hypothetical protein